VNCSRVRKDWKHEHDGLSVLDYPSFHPTHHMQTLADQFQFQDQLRKLCAFLCWRKESSRTASLLLLRFFWGFELQEIMAITGLTRTAVDNQISAARKEARRYLNAPVGFQAGRKATPAFKEAGLQYVANPEDLFAQFRATITRARSGSCAARGKRHPAQGHEHGKPLTIAELDHLVSCRKCLNHVARMMNLTTPGERWLLDESSTNRNGTRRTMRYQRPHMIAVGSATDLIRGGPDDGNDRGSYWSLLLFPIVV
jgi:hypothetical protein